MHLSIYIYFSFDLQYSQTAFSLLLTTLLHDKQVYLTTANFPRPVLVNLGT